MLKLQLRQLEDGADTPILCRHGPSTKTHSAPVPKPSVHVSQHPADKQVVAIILPALPKGTTSNDNSGNIVAAATAGVDKDMVVKVEEVMDLNQSESD